MNTTGTTRIRTYLFPGLICLMFLTAGVLRLNDLSLYTPDSTRYLIWGDALSKGKGFVDETQPEAVRFVVHAPLYPLLLVPGQWIVPFSVSAAKITSLVFAVLTLLAFFVWLRKSFGGKAAIAGMIILAVNPLMFVYATEILSEAPFLFFLVMVFVIMQMRSPAVRGRTWIFIGVLLGALPLLREVGAALVLAVMIQLLLERKWTEALIAVLPVLLFSGIWYVRNSLIVGAEPGSQGENISLVLQHFLTAPGSPLVKEWLARGLLNAGSYGMELTGMLLYPLYGSHQVNLALSAPQFPVIFQGTLAVVLGGGVVYGFYTDFLRSHDWPLRFLFCIIYILFVLLYPLNDIRFLLPLLPMMIYYLISGISDLLERYSLSLVAGAAVLVMIPNLKSDAAIVETNLAYCSAPVLFFNNTLRNSEEYPIIYTQPWSVLGRWISDSLPSGSTIATPVKDLVTVSGGRRVLELEPGIPLPDFESALRDNGVEYLLAPVFWEDMVRYEFLMRESRRFRFARAFTCANLCMFRVESRIAEQGGKDSAALDTLPGAQNALRNCRDLLVDGDFTGAQRWLERATHLAPEHPEVLYHGVILACMSGDSAVASTLYTKLLQRPQAGSYAFVARSLMQTGALIRSARAAKYADERAIKFNDAALQYWKAGFPRHAATVADSACALDSSYFVGLLWGFHFHHQLGDSLAALRYLGRLDKIDSTNQVVRVFHQLLDIGEMLHDHYSRADRARFHLMAATLYRKIELFEEAADEAQRSLVADPQNAEALAFLADGFARKFKWRTAESYYRKAALSDPENQTFLHRADSLRLLLGKP